MRILITGFNGLIGVHLAKLISNNSRILCDLKIFSLTRSNNINSHSLPSYAITNTLIKGDCDSKDDLVNALVISKPNLIIHIAQIRYSKNLIEAISSLKISPHLIIVGTTGVFSKFPSCSSEYVSSEKIILDSIYNFNLIRPSMIYGSMNDKNLHILMQNIIKGIPIPIVNKGKSLFQPVFYKDISLVIYNLLNDFYDSNYIQRSCWNCPGPDKISFKEMCDLIALISGRNIKYINLPYNPFYLFCNSMEFFLKDKSPIKGEQILRLKEDKVYHSDMLRALKGRKSTSFKNGINYLYDSLRNYNFN